MGSHHESRAFRFATLVRSALFFMSVITFNVREVDNPTPVLNAFVRSDTFIHEQTLAVYRMMYVES